MRMPLLFCAAHVVLSILISVTSLPSYAQLPPKTVTEDSITRQDIEFLSGDVTLSGTIVMPVNIVAAVVVVHGSGKAPRNMHFAQALAQHGLATLTYDKRGVGRSGGKYAGPEVGTNNIDTANLQLLAEDAAAAIRKLSHRVSPSRVPIGLIGMSQAGWIIPLAAVRSPEVKFMVIWSGPMVTTLEQLRFQFLTDGRADFWDTRTEAQAREQIRLAPDRYQFAPTDPVVALRNVSIPGLWLYGQKDLNVPVGLSIERLDSLVSSGKRFDHIEFQEAGHQLPFKEALSASMDWLWHTAIREPSSRK